MPRSVQVDRQEFARLWEEGVPSYRIAERLGIHANTVTRMAYELRLPRRGRKVDVPTLFLLWADMTLTRVEVARKLGVTEGNLTRLAERYERRAETATATDSKLSKRRARCLA